MKLLSKLSRRYVLLGALGILLVVLVIAAACGEEATPTPAPAATATPRPAPTATTAPQPTSAPTTTLRPRAQWTEENPATLAEIEAELAKHKGESFVIVSWGGAYQAAQRQAYFNPFEEKFNIDVVEESAPAIAKFRAQVETKNITWDLVDWGTVSVFQLMTTNSLEPFDFTVVDTRDYLDVVNQTKPFGGTGGITWSTAFAYNTEKYPEGGLRPTTWADFFDWEKFPGRRGLSDWYSDDLHFFYLALHPELLNTLEGRTSISSLTDAQVDEALEFFRGLKGKPGYDLIYWNTGSACPELLIAGEVVMCNAWNGRIFDAAKAGNPIRVCWECGHLLQTDVWTIPAGQKELAPNKYELANLFTAWAGAAENNVQMTKYISYGPMNLKSIPLLEGAEYAEVRDQLPSSATNIQYAIIANEDWFGKVGDAVQERFLSILQE